jgi:tripartite-type tricarboxylate transporter receptor subunit TctC
MIRNTETTILRGLVATCMLACVAAAPAFSQSYPARPVTVIIPFGAGSATDTAARRIAAHLQATLGQGFVVENRTGANGLLAATAVARAAGDGHTLLITTNSTHSAAPGLTKVMPYDPIKDFTPIARLGVVRSFLAVNPGLPIKSPQELVAYAKANPGKLSYGHGNTTGQVTGETVKNRTGIDIVRVAYRTNPPALTDLIAGHIGVMVPDFTTGIPQVRAGKIRPIAQLTKDKSPQLPDVPTLDETIVPDFDLVAWVGMFAPANTPPEVVRALSGSLEKMAADPQMREQFATNGMEVQWGNAELFTGYVRTELVKWTTLIKAAGIEPE